MSRPLACRPKLSTAVIADDDILCHRIMMHGPVLRIVVNGLGHRHPVVRVGRLLGLGRTARATRRTTGRLRCRPAVAGACGRAAFRATVTAGAVVAGACSRAATCLALASIGTLRRRVPSGLIAVVLRPGLRALGILASRVSLLVA